MELPDLNPYATSNRDERPVGQPSMSGANKPSDFSEYFSAGNKHLKSGKLRAASDAYSNALALRPGNLAALNNLAAVHIEQERWQEAIDLCQRVLDKDPCDFEANLNMADAQMGAKDFATAIHHYKLALESRTSVRTKVKLGLAYSELQDERLARIEYRAAIDLDPNSPDAYCMLAYSLILDRDWAEGSAVTMLAREKFPKDPRFIPVHAMIIFFQRENWNTTKLFWNAWRSNLRRVDFLISAALCPMVFAAYLIVHYFTGMEFSSGRDTSE